MYKIYSSIYRKLFMSIYILIPKHLRIRKLLITGYIINKFHQLYVYTWKILRPMPDSSTCMLSLRHQTHADSQFMKCSFNNCQELYNLNGRKRCKKPTLNNSE